jgi:hypothetical protein
MAESEQLSSVAPVGFSSAVAKRLAAAPDWKERA